MDFESLAKICENLTKTKKHNLKINIVSDFLKCLNPEELEPAISMMLGHALPNQDQKKLFISWNTIWVIIKKISNTSFKEFSKVFRETGDLGSATQTIMKNKQVRKQCTIFNNPLTILEVRNVLESISNTTGIGSKERKARLVESLLAKSKPLEAKYLVKIMIDDMRIGFQDGLMKIAVSQTFSIPIVKLENAFMFIENIGEVAKNIKIFGINSTLNIGPKLFQPFKPMLAQKTDNPMVALKIHGGKSAFEYKLDGARIQIHKSNCEIKIFSRRLLNITLSFPEIVKLVRNKIKVKNAILEGELIAVEKDGNPMPFQYIMRRFLRVKEIEKNMIEIPVHLYIFDIIFVDSKNLADKPYFIRREKLEKIVDEKLLVRQIVTDNPVEAKNFLLEAINNRHEGLIAKRLESIYTPGLRGKHWLKIKKGMDLLDLVIVEAEYGYGRRHKWLSNYHIAAKDVKTGNLLIIGKTFKGLTDSEIDWMTQTLKKITIREEGGKVIVYPKIVVEVAYDEIQKSSKYKSGVALRFARITKIREDKNHEDIDTIQKVYEIYKSQFIKSESH
jgi:DNA ligase-1